MERPVIVYCGACKMPPEYCEFGKEIAKCQKWLVENAPEMVARVWPELGLSALKVGEPGESGASGEASGETLEPQSESTGKQKKSKAKPKGVTVQTVERTKRKRTTVILGLDQFDVDLKQAAKLFGKKFACGAGVTTLATGQDEVTIQGDFSDQVVEMIPHNWKHIQAGDVQLLETKKK